MMSRHMRRPHKKRLLDVLERFGRQKVAVLGDMVLDEFVYGEIARVSREAPVLILEHRQSRTAPGGAANAVANLRALGAHPIPVGRVGQDEASDSLLALLKERGVDCRGIIRDSSHVTPVKSRVLAGSPHTAKQQIVRIDRGTVSRPPATSVRRRISRNLALARGRASGLLVADYGYGTVEPADPEMARWIEADSLPVVLDSRFRLPSFPGVTAATPNLAEVEAAMGVSLPDEDTPALERAGKGLLARLRSKALLVTRGSRGISLFERGRGPEHVPAYGTDEVADVTGAGDTVAATFTLAVLSGGSFLEAAVLANYAGGIVVTKRGTATVTCAELSAAVEEDA